MFTVNFEQGNFWRKLHQTFDFGRIRHVNAKELTLLVVCHQFCNEIRVSDAGNISIQMCLYVIILCLLQM